MKKKKQFAKGGLIEQPVSLTFHSAGFGDFSFDETKPVVLYGSDEFNKKQKLYMAYGYGCKNKSEIYVDKKAFQVELEKLGKDKDWTGDIVGFELKPIFKVKKEVKVVKV